MEGNRMNRKAALLIVLVFVLGIGIGAVGTYVAEGRVRAVNRPHVDMRARVMERLTTELTLTKEQQKQLDSIITEIQARHEALNKEIAPRMDQLRQQGRDEIRAILTPEQKTKYEEYLRKADEERKRMEEERKKNSGR
jgi:Skp family chaperone for outer membrane proteins